MQQIIKTFDGEICHPLWFYLLERLVFTIAQRMHGLQPKNHYQFLDVYISEIYGIKSYCIE